MHLNVSLPLFIKNGVGSLKFPEAFKRAPLQVYIGCDSAYFSLNTSARNEPCFITCSGSFYHTHNHEVKPNILGMFQNKRTANLVNFSKKFPITSAQETLELEIVDFHYNRQNISCLAVFELEGLVRNKLLTI